MLAFAFCGYPQYDPPRLGIECYKSPSDRKAITAMRCGNCDIVDGAFFNNFCADRHQAITYPEGLAALGGKPGKMDARGRLIDIRDGGRS
ncbi:hypothetical protein FHX06_007166 [Rhizobium sp. BK512]|nr:hypothetical protein [Rhizobium sp. BK512]